MTIRTPDQLTTYLSALAQQMPRVAHVVTGEGSRSEEDSLSSAAYPEVLIETPEVVIPLASSPKTLSTRVFVLDIAGDGGRSSEDMAMDVAYGIAEDIVSTIRMHEQEDDYGYAVVGDSLEITPVISRGSDQRRGWMFEIMIEVDQVLCRDRGYDPQTFFMPQFSWSLSDATPGAPTIDITDESVGSADSETWYWQEIHEQPVAAEISEGPIDLSPTDPVSTYRTIHLWKRMVLGTVTLWAYACIDSRIASGHSTASLSIYPI